MNAIDTNCLNLSDAREYAEHLQELADSLSESISETEAYVLELEQSATPALWIVRTGRMNHARVIRYTELRSYARNFRGLSRAICRARVTGKYAYVSELVRTI